MSYDSTIEDLVSNVEGFIRDNVGTYVTGVNDAKSDGVSLKAIREVEVSDTDPYTAKTYPRIQLFVENLNIEHIAAGWANATMTFIAVVAMNEKSNERKRLLRYTEAFRQTLRDYRDTVSSFDVDTAGMTITYYPTSDNGISVATVAFNVMQEIPT